MDARTALFRARSCKALALRSRVVEVAHRSDRLGSGRVALVDTRPSAGHDVVGRSGRRVDPRSSRVVVECGAGSHHDADCRHVADRRGDRSSHRQEVDRRSHRRGRGSLANESDSAHVDAGPRFVACGHQYKSGHIDITGLHLRCSGLWSP